MSVLELIGSILTELEKVQEKLDRLLASGSNKFTVDIVEEPKSVMGHVITYTNAEMKEVLKESKEEVDMDFSKVTVMNQTEKALLVVKKGYQQWLAKSLIKGGGEGYDNGNVYDITILEISPKSNKPTKWVYKKWEPFEVFKN